MFKGDAAGEPFLQARLDLKSVFHPCTDKGFASTIKGEAEPVDGQGNRILILSTILALCENKQVALAIIFIGAFHIRLALA